MVIIFTFFLFLNIKLFLFSIIILKNGVKMLNLACYFFGISTYFCNFANEFGLTLIY